MGQLNITKEDFVDLCNHLTDNASRSHELCSKFGIDLSSYLERLYKANSILLRGCFCEWKAELIEDYLYPIFGGHEIKLYSADGKKVVNLINSHGKLWEYLNSTED